MPDCEQLLEKARNNQNGIRFDDLCALAECFGWRLARKKGSHSIYKYPGHARLMNFQNVKRMAKPYQVRQLLDAIAEMNEDGGTR